MYDGFYEYEVKYYDEFDGVMLIRHGVVYADSYAAAVEHISDYYGDKWIDYLTITGLEPATVYEIEDTYRPITLFKVSCKEVSH